MALVVGSAGLALPWVVAHPHKVQDFLSARMGRPVTIGSLTGAWTVVGPVFQLRDVQIERPGGRGQPFRIDSAELAIDFYASLKSGVSFSEFRLLGLDLDLVLRSDGGLQVARLGRAGAGAAGAVSGADALLDLGSLNLREARVTLRDETSGRSLALERVDLRYASERGARRIGGRAWARSGGVPLRFACELEGTALRRCHVAGQGLAPAEWLANWPLSGVAPVSGSVDLQAWVDVAHGPSAVQVELATHALALRGVEPIAFSTGDLIEPRASLDGAALSLHWRRGDDGWRLDLAERGTRGQATELSLVAAGAAPARAYTLAAARIDLGRWAAPLALGDFLPARMRAPLYETSPRGALERVTAAREAGGAWSLSARVAGLSLQPARRTPGFSPLSGTLLADEAATVWALDPDQALQLDFPHVFRAPIEARLAQRHARRDAHAGRLADRGQRARFRRRGLRRAGARRADPRSGRQQAAPRRGGGIRPGTGHGGQGLLADQRDEGDDPRVARPRPARRPHGLGRGHRVRRPRRLAVPAGAGTLRGRGRLQRCRSRLPPALAGGAHRPRARRFHRRRHAGARRGRAGAGAGGDERAGDHRAFRHPGARTRGRGRWHRSRVAALPAREPDPRHCRRLPSGPGHRRQRHAGLRARPAAGRRQRRGHDSPGSPTSSMPTSAAVPGTSRWTAPRAGCASATRASWPTISR